jgi:ribonuclease HI
LTVAPARPYNPSSFQVPRITTEGTMADAPLLTIHTDGASRGNPGAAAYAYTIEQEGQDPIEEAGCLGMLTNNQAEYTALVRALEHALRLGPEHRILLHSDSELMVKQMRGEYRVKNEELRDLYEQAKELASRFTGGVTYRHVRRELNSRADALCNEVLDGKRLSSPAFPTLPQAAPSLIVQPAAAPSLRQEAVAYLKGLEGAWSRGGARPTAEEAWERLAAILREHGVNLPR